MANHNREDLEKQAQAGTDAAIGGLLGLAALFVGGVIANSSEKKKLQTQAAELEDAIRKCNQGIAEYESKFLGKTLYSDEINALRKKRDAYYTQLSEVRKKLG